MLGLFRSPRRPSPRPVRRTVRLCLERLEARDCPAAPAITAFTATTLPGHLVRLSGTVTDANPASVRVMFSGAASGNATADASGQFSYTTSNASLGTVNAVATDGQMLQSNTFSTNITNAAPTINLTVTFGQHTTVTLSGSVNDVDLGMLMVNFSGVVTASVTTNPDGTFSYTGSASGPGKVTVSVTDQWQMTGTTSTTLAPAAPVISNFQASQGANNMWTFSGQVTDASGAQGLQVNITGIPGFAGAMAIVQANGSFSVTVQLAPNATGTATAITTDWWGLSSNTAWTIL